MSCCPHCVDAEGLFSERTARRDLKRYRRRGPRPSTRLLVSGLLATPFENASLLDVGGGVGPVQHELLADGVERATHVDASAAYLEASRREAEARGNADRVRYVHGDFVELADSLPGADIVTLDRVICCYPYLERLVDASAAKARLVYGVVYPRERRVTRFWLALGNLYFRVSGSAFRTFIHPVAAIDAAIRRNGFTRAFHARTFFWEIATYTRGPISSSAVKRPDAA